jgi:hypothetical protein
MNSLFGKLWGRAIYPAHDDDRFALETAESYSKSLQIFPPRTLSIPEYRTVGITASSRLS